MIHHLNFSHLFGFVVCKNFHPTAQPVTLKPIILEFIQHFKEALQNTTNPPLGQMTSKLEKIVVFLCTVETSNDLAHTQLFLQTSSLFSLSEQIVLYNLSINETIPENIIQSVTEIIRKLISLASTLSDELSLETLFTYFDYETFHKTTFTLFETLVQNWLNINAPNEMKKILSNQLTEVAKFQNATDLGTLVSSGHALSESLTKFSAFLKTSPSHPDQPLQLLHFYYSQFNQTLFYIVSQKLSQPNSVLHSRPLCLGLRTIYFCSSFSMLVAVISQNFSQ